MNDEETNQDARFLPVREAAARCGVTGATIRNWIRRGCPHRKRPRVGAGDGYRLFVDPYDAVQWCAKEGLSGRRGRRSTEDRVRAERRADEARRMRERAGLPVEEEEDEEEEEEEAPAPASAPASAPDPAIPPARPLDGSDAERLLAAKLRKEIALATKHELTIAKIRGELLDASDVRVQRLRRIEVVKSGLLGLGVRLAPRLVGLEAQAIEVAIEEEVRLLLVEYSQGVSE